MYFGYYPFYGHLVGKNSFLFCMLPLSLNDGDLFHAQLSSDIRYMLQHNKDSLLQTYSQQKIKWKEMQSFYY